MLHMLASVLSFGLFQSSSAIPIETLRVAAQPRVHYGKSSGGRGRGLPWRKCRFRHMRGIAVPDWQTGEPIHMIGGVK